MGEVAIIYRIMPDGPEIDLENLKQKVIETIPKHARLNNVEEKPVAFGLKALEIQIILNDRQGGVDAVEEALRKIENVQSVETVQLGLL